MIESKFQVSILDHCVTCSTYLWLPLDAEEEMHHQPHHLQQDPGKEEHGKPGIDKGGHNRAMCHILCIVNVY